MIRYGVAKPDRISCVQALRKAKGLTQEELAERSGKSVDTLSLVERGRILPALDTLIALAQGLETPVLGLLPEEATGPHETADVMRLREAAWSSLCQMDHGRLKIAVAQLSALVRLAAP